MRKGIAGSVMAALLAAGALAVAPTASAAPAAGWWDADWVTSDAAHGGEFYVHAATDTLELCDQASDGLAPRATISYKDAYGTSTQYILTASGGNGSCVVSQESMGGYADLPELRTIYVDMGLGPNYKYEVHRSFYNY